MTRDDIIRLARESGIIQPEIVFTHLERFAALVAAVEREACAKYCEELDKYWFWSHFPSDIAGWLREEKHHRARGQE